MSLLGNILGGGGRGGMSPLTLGLLGLLAYRTYKGKGRLADILGKTGTNAPSEKGGLDGLLGGLFGGGAGAAS